MKGEVWCSLSNVEQELGSFMASLDQTIQVLDLSPKVTLTDLNTFFSYCGTVEKISLERKEDQSQLAYVTFRQPFALQTALLLDGAVIGNRCVRIMRLRNIDIESPSVAAYNTNNITKKQKNEKQSLIPTAHSLVQTMASIGIENLSKAKAVLDERYKLPEKRNALTQQTRMAISAAEHTVGSFGEAIVNNECFSAGALWVSAALDKAAKCAAELGSHNKRNDHNSLVKQSSETHFRPNAHNIAK